MSAALRSRTRSIDVVVILARGWDALAASTNRPRSLSISFQFCCGGRCHAERKIEDRERRQCGSGRANGARELWCYVRRFVRFAQGKLVCGFPVLQRWQMWCKGAEHRAGAAGEIDDRERGQYG